MARPPAGRPNPDEPVPPDEESVPPDEFSGDADDETDDETDDEAAEGVEGTADGSARSGAASRFWSRARVEPVEVALPGGAGYTLRAYRQNTDITPADVSEREDDVALPRRRLETAELDEAALDAEADADMADVDFADTDADDGDELDEEEAAAEEVEAAEPDEVVEEVPLFLSHAGHLLVFRSAESLVEFVLSDAEHDLQQLDTWDAVTRGIQPEYVVALPDDTYELDLVVKNLRGGHDVWDPDLLLRSGQFARDVGHALSVESVVMALSPGSPLDDLDEALRAVADGGLGSFLARRRLKKVGAETASLGWRTVVGKISAVVDWRD